VQIEKCCKKIFKKLAMPLNLSLQIMLFKFTREMTINKYEGFWKTGTVDLTKEDSGSDSSSTESEKAKQTPSKKRKGVHAKTPSPKSASKPAKKESKNKSKKLKSSKKETKTKSKSKPSKEPNKTAIVPIDVFSPTTVVCLGVSGKSLYARGSVVRQGSKLAGRYNNQALTSFVELTSLQSVADQCTVIFPKDAVYVVLAT
jgi:hypothetical protein